MARRPSAPRTVDFDDLNARLSLPAPSRVPREAAELVEQELAEGATAPDESPIDLDRVLTEPPPSGRPDSGIFTVAPSPLAPPTLAPPGASSSSADSLPLLRAAVAVLLLLAASAASYVLGHQHGHVDGHLEATRTHLATAPGIAALDGSEPEGAGRSPSATTSTAVEGLGVATPTVADERAEAAASADAPAVDTAPLFRPLSASAAPPERVAVSAPLAPPTPAEPEVEAVREESAEPTAQTLAPGAADEPSVAAAELDSPEGAEAAPSTTEVADAVADAVADVVAAEGEAVAEGQAAATVATSAEEASASTEGEAVPTPGPRSLAELLGQQTNEPAAPALPERPSRSDVRAALNEVVPGVRRCAGGAGPITVGIRVAPAGNVTSARVTEGELSPAVTGCVVSAVSAASFPAFSGRDFHISYPFRL